MAAVPAVVTVPDLVGLTVSMACDLGYQEGVAVAAGDVDGPPLDELTRPDDYVVTAQHPPPATRVPHWSVIVIWFAPEEGGDAGDRAPLRPPPDPRAMRASRRPEDADPPEDTFWPGPARPRTPTQTGTGTASISA